VQAVVNVAFEKIKRWCAQQERSHFEVKKKLQSLGVYAGNAEALLVKLIEENYVNEQRFAQGFARGKFALKKWGRIKISYELAQKKVSGHNIKTSLKEIGEADYLQTLQKLAEKKWALLADESLLNRQGKTINYLLQKGYEMPLIKQCLTGLKDEG
jgi:regulatory protein